MRIALAALMVAIAVMLFGCSGSDSVEPSQQSSDSQVQQQDEPAPAAEPVEQDVQPDPVSEQSQQQEAAEPQTDTAEETSEQPTETATEQQSAAQQPEQPAEQQAEEAEQVPDGTRIISLFGDISEILYALDVEDYVVGVDVSSVFPEAAQELPDVGFAGALNAEGILALSPTIVIGGGIVPPGPPGVLEQLEQAGVEVLILPELVGLDAPGVKIRMIGDAIGIPRRAEVLALQVERDIELAKPKPDSTGENTELKVLFVYLRRGGIQLVSGAGREAETIITASGGVDAGTAAGIDGWQPLSPEALLSIDPDVYLVMQLGFDAVGGIDGLLDIPGMAETEAGKHRRVIVMEDILLLGFGPRMAETIVQLRDYLDEVRASLKESSGAEE